MTKKANAKSLPYRPCVGIALFNAEGLVWIGNRSDENAEEDAADAKDGATKDAAELRLNQLKEVQSALGRG